jgi:hypothetical protein
MKHALAKAAMQYAKDQRFGTTEYWDTLILRRYSVCPQTPKCSANPVQSVRLVRAVRSCWAQAPSGRWSLIEAPDRLWHQWVEIPTRP